MPLLRRRTWKRSCCKLLRERQVFWPVTFGANEQLPSTIRQQANGAFNENYYNKKRRVFRSAFFIILQPQLFLFRLPEPGLSLEEGCTM